MAPQLSGDVQRDLCTSGSMIFTVQKSLCTYVVKGHTVQKAVPLALLHPKLGTNSFKFQLAPKFTEPRAAGFFTRCGPNRRKKVLLRRLGHTSAARGPGGGSPPLRAGKPPPTPSGVAQSPPRPHFFDPSLPFPSLCTFLVTFLSTQFRHNFLACLFHSISHFL